MLDTGKGQGSAAEAAFDPALQSVDSATASTGLRRLHPADGCSCEPSTSTRSRPTPVTWPRWARWPAAPASCTGSRSTSTRTAGRSAPAPGWHRPVRPGAAQPQPARGRAGWSRARRGRPGLDRGGGRPPPIPSGNEPVYAAACATSCGPDSSIQPWLDDAVELRVAPRR